MRERVGECSTCAFVKTVAETLSEPAAAGGSEPWSGGGWTGYSSLRTAGVGVFARGPVQQAQRQLLLGNSHRGQH